MPLTSKYCTVMVIKTITFGDENSMVLEQKWVCRTMK